MIKSKILCTIAALMFVGFYRCANAPSSGGLEIKEVDVAVIDSVAVVPAPLRVRLSGRVVVDIGLIAVKKGLVITPFPIPGMDTLSYYINHDLATCCPALHPLVHKGRGPGEVSFIRGAGKSLEGDSLLLYSQNEAKFLFYDEELALAREQKMFEALYARGSFAFRKGIFFVPQNTSNNGGHLFRIVDLEQETTASAITPRVPQGYQPQVRNFVSSMAPTPDGAVFSYTGDRELLFMDTEGVIDRSLRLGPNDPIEIRKSDPEGDGSSAPDYITKIEFSEGHVYVLYNYQNILIFSYPDLVPKKRLIILRDANEERPIVTGFSVYNDLLYVAYWGEQISQVKLNPDWLSD